MVRIRAAGIALLRHVTRITDLALEAAQLGEITLLSAVLKDLIFEAADLVCWLEHACRGKSAELSCLDCGLAKANQQMRIASLVMQHPETAVPKDWYKQLMVMCDRHMEEQAYGRVWYYDYETLG